MTVKTEEIIRTERIHTHYCDVCGAVCRNTCKICGKDICGVHRIQDPEDWNTDYPRYFCTTCWEIGIPFREELNRMRTEFEVEEDLLIQKWRDACKVNK